MEEKMKPNTEKNSHTHAHTHHCDLLSAFHAAEDESASLHLNLLILVPFPTLYISPPGIFCFLFLSFFCITLLWFLHLRYSAAIPTPLPLLLSPIHFFTLSLPFPNPVSLCWLVSVWSSHFCPVVVVAKKSDLEWILLFICLSPCPPCRNKCISSSLDRKKRPSTGLLGYWLVNGSVGTVSMTVCSLLRAAPYITHPRPSPWFQTPKRCFNQLRCNAIRF